MEEAEFEYTRKREKNALEDGIGWTDEGGFLLANEKKKLFNSVVVNAET